MSDDEIAELEKAYNEASQGTAAPQMIVMGVPGVGYVVATRNSVTVEGIAATDEQISKIKHYMMRKKVPGPIGV